MAKEYITLMDGTVVENAYPVKMGDEKIAVYVVGDISFGDMTRWFCDEARTETMESNQYGDIRVWNGYTVPVALEVFEDRACICLEKRKEN